MFARLFSGRLCATRSVLIVCILAVFTLDLRAETAARAYLVTNSASDNKTAVHLINPGNHTQTFRGSLFTKSGEPLGSADVLLHNGSVAPQGRVILSAEDLED